MQSPSAGTGGFGCESQLTSCLTQASDLTSGEMGQQRFALWWATGQENGSVHVKVFRTQPDPSGFNDC